MAAMAERQDSANGQATVAAGTIARRRPLARWLLWISNVILAVATLHYSFVTWIAAAEWRNTGLVCLMYHRFATPADYARLSDDDRVYTIDVNRFAEQMALLESQGWRPISFDQALAGLRRGRSFPHHATLLTIDDGSRNVVTLAEPILRKHGWRATLFLTTDPDAYVFRDGPPDSQRLTADEIRRLDPAVWDLGAHGHTHRPLRDLPIDEMRSELAKSRDTLATLTGRVPVAMSVPGNWYDDAVLREAKAAGFEAVFVSDPGSVLPTRDPDRIRRLMVSGTWPTDKLARDLPPDALGRRRALADINRALGRVLPRPILDGVSSMLQAMTPTNRHAILGLLSVSLMGTVVLAWLTRRVRPRPDAQ